MHGLAKQVAQRRGLTAKVHADRICYRRQRDTSAMLHTGHVKRLLDAAILYGRLGLHSTDMMDGPVCPTQEQRVAAQLTSLAHCYDIASNGPSNGIANANVWGQ